MKCPFCAVPETKVIDSRLNQLGDMIRRRRSCPRCEGRFTTYERVEEVMPVVIKKDGRREPFNRAKVADGLKKATQKRSIPVQKIEELITLIEKNIQSIGAKEIPSARIGQMVMSELRKLDKVAYVRFASVYRDFRDIDEFVAELTTGDPAEEDLTESEMTTLSFPFVAGGDDPDKGSGKAEK